MSKVHKALVNAGARLYKRKNNRLAKTIWSLPGVLKNSSPVNVKKYLLLANDKEFSNFVKGNYFSIANDDDLLAWVYNEASRRSLSQIVNVIMKGFTYDDDFLLDSMEKCLEVKNYAQLALLVKSIEKDPTRFLQKSTSFNKILVGALCIDEEILKGISLDSNSKRLLKLIFSYYRHEKIKTPSTLSSLIENDFKSLDEGLKYSYCQLIQTTEETRISIRIWIQFISDHPSNIRARQNLMLLMCKIDDSDFCNHYKWLSDRNELTDRLIENAYKSANRINSVDFLSKLESVKKKTQYSLKVSLEINRKNDFMDDVNDLERKYKSLYGEDKWFLTFKAKKLIDFGEYEKATMAFKDLKGQKLYYAISLLKNRDIEKSYKVLNSFKSNHKDYFAAQRNIADIYFYEKKDWKRAAISYERVLNHRFDYQLKLRYLKSKIQEGEQFKNLSGIGAILRFKI